MNQIPLMIAGAQLGITICSLGLGAIAEPALAHLLEAPFDAVGLPERRGAPGRVRPRPGRRGLPAHGGRRDGAEEHHAGRPGAVRARGSGPPMLAFCMATKPLLVGDEVGVAAVLRLWQIEATDAVKTVFTAEELAGLVTQARTEGLLDAEQHARITGALALQRPHRRATRCGPGRGVTTVADDVVAGVARGARDPHRPVPVPGGAARRPGGCSGFVHVKDVLGYAGAAAPRRRSRPS